MDPTTIETNDTLLSPAIDEDALRLLQREFADKITALSSVDDLMDMLRKGAKPTVPITRGLTPLHYACFINHIAAAQLLLDAGAEVDTVDEVGCSAIHLCAEHGHIEMLRLLLEKIDTVRQFEKLPERDERGRYPSRNTVDEPLRTAIKNEHFECARALLERGANPNATYFEGPEITLLSPLDTDFLELLLKHGANPNVFDRKGLTPLMRACRLREKGIPAIEILLRYKANINTQAESRQDFRTALHFAVHSGSPDLVKFMIEKSADVHLPKDYRKPSVLDAAVLKDDPAMLKVVLDAGADPCRVYTYVGSALHLACCSSLENQLELIKMLLDSGADPNLSYNFDDGSTLKTPFVEYFKSRDVVDERVVDLLLSYGARVVMKSPVSHPCGQLRNVIRLVVGDKQNPRLVRKMLSFAEDFDTMAISRLPVPEPLRKCLLYRARNPLSLQETARNVLRHLTAPVRPEVIQSLPIPEHLKDFVLGMH